MLNGINTVDYLTTNLFYREFPHLLDRSRFYNLEPIGIGTNEVESFSSYISRLALEHLVTPIILIKNSVNSSNKLPQVFRENSLPQIAVANLNGFGETSEKLLNLFEKATFRQDIKFTTLFAWKNRISNHGLLRKNLAWCSYCFQEQLNQNGIIYEKLIWTFETVKGCLIHQVKLSEICSYCQNKLKVLSVKSSPGFCSKCLKWLGSQTIFEKEEIAEKEIWIARNVEQMLLINSQITNSFSANFANLIQQTTIGNINDFAYLTGVWHLSIRRLLKREVLPTLPMLIDICYPIDFPITELFFEKPKFKEDKKSRNTQKNNSFSKDKVILILPNYLVETTPPSLNEVCRRIGWTTTRFQRHFPNDYRQIVDRYLQSQKGKSPNFSDGEIEEILNKASKEHPPPSLQSIFRRIGCRNTGYRYYQKFPELCQQISNRYKQANKKVFDLEKAELTLKSALKEKPIPSFSEVARRLKCSRETLNKKLPKLSTKYHKKYAEFLKKSSEQNKQEMNEEIRQVISELINQQESFTENAVRKLMKRKWNDKNFKLAYNEIKLKLGI
jgi:DNA-binding transcriptional regulator YhcF (GntR family)